MKYVEAPALTQRDMNSMLLYLFESLGKSDRKDTIQTGDLLDPLAEVACEARDIGNHHEVGFTYLQERIYRTIRDGMATEEGGERPCSMYVGSPMQPRDNDDWRTGDALIPLMVRCTNYRPFSKQHSSDYDARYRRSDNVYPLLIARVASISSSIDGLLYCKVVGPPPYAQERETNSSARRALASTREYQETLDFPEWKNTIVIPMRDVEMTPEAREKFERARVRKALGRD